MATKKFLDYDGLAYYNSKIQAQLDTKIEDVEVDGVSVVVDKVAQIDLATPLAGKQDALTTAQLAVVNANPFTTPERDKLAGIQAGAQANTIQTISVNGVNVAPDGSRNVDIDVPTHLSDLDATGFNFVESITAGSPNVVIGGTAKNPTITVSALDMPDDFTSTEEPTGAIGTLLQGLDSTVLTPVISGATLSLGDNIIFANNIQAIVSAIDEGNDQYDAVVSRIPAEVSFPAITGDPMTNTALASALNSKLNVTDIAAITNSEIDTIMGL